MRLDVSIPCSPADPVTRTHGIHVESCERGFYRSNGRPAERIHPDDAPSKTENIRNPARYPYRLRATLLEFVASLARMMTVDEVTLRFVPGHLQGLVTLLASRLFPRSYLPPFGDESASEVSPSEVSPSVDRSSSPRPGLLAVRRRPSRTTEVARSDVPSTSRLCSRRRSVGALTPRSSPGRSSLQGFQSSHPPTTLSGAGPSMRFSVSCPQGAVDAGALRCVLREDPLSSFEVAHPPGLLNLMLFSVSLRVEPFLDYGFSSAVPSPCRGFRRLWTASLST